MAERPRHPYRRAIRVLVIAAAVLCLAAGGLYGGWKLRKRHMVQRALTAGNAAYERADWATARLELGRYLSVHQDDPEVLRRYGYAQLAMRPVKPENLRQAATAYRRLLALRPHDEDAFRRLALLYENTGDYAELAHVAQKRLEAVPGDLAATVALAKDLIFREKRDAARETLKVLVTSTACHPAACREYVEACALLSELTAAAGGAEAGSKALEWLDRAVQSCPSSATALVRFHRPRKPGNCMNHGHHARGRFATARLRRVRRVKG